MKVVDPSRKVFRTISLSFVGLWIYAALRPQKKKKKKKKKKTRRNMERKIVHLTLNLECVLLPLSTPQSPRKEKEKTVKNVLSNKLPDFITVK